MFASVSPFLQVIEALNRHDVRYVIVGGFATIMHGNNRTTADLDMVVDLRPQEAKKAIDALLSIGFQSRLPVDPYLFADSEHREKWYQEKNVLVFSMFDPDRSTLIVDLFVRPPIDFESLFDHSVLVSLQGVAVRICSLDDLIDMKLKSGRPQDLLDVDALRIIKTRGNPPTMS